MEEHVLTWRKAPAAASQAESSLRLIDMPTGLRRAPAQVRAAEALGPAARGVLLEALAALRVSAALSTALVITPRVRSGAVSPLAIMAKR